jgi:hypothetical protein
MHKHKPFAAGMALFETESRKSILPPLEGKDPRIGCLLLR